jgi:predicted secreted protein
MSIRTIASGSNIMAFQQSGTEGAYTYKPIAGQTNTTLAVEPSDREVSNKNQGKWKSFEPGLMAWNATVDISITEDTDANEVSWDDLEELKFSRAKTTIVIAHVEQMESSSDTPTIDTTKKMWRGLAMVNFPLNASHGENMTTSVTFQGCLELEIIDPT